MYIILHLILCYILLLRYAIAIGITHFINEDMVNIAWDSAGVTTGLCLSERARER